MKPKDIKQGKFYILKNNAYGPIQVQYCDEILHAYPNGKILSVEMVLVSSGRKKK